ncbi:MAG: hypothetical protein MH204_05510, partial [Fimbriimonadaceae bacterium]|nr:hypothetical protein [Fimbriimonadaceae bacterium]
MRGLPEDDPLHTQLMVLLNKAVNMLSSGDKRARSNTRRLLQDGLASLTGEMNHEITAVGHAHLDTAWLWPLSVTRLKMNHTTAIQLGMVERYPEYVFVHSQASQYEWLEKNQPEMLDRIRGAMKKGQWEAVGSMWVEADCNLTGSESLVRQFLYGRRWFQKKLGVTTEDMWLPDVFGYSAAIPQILTKFGIKYFLTQKLSWNDTNKIPHHTFLWEGIDGSRVWSHFPPADTYNASAEPKEIVESVRKFKDHGRSDHSLLLFGFGDGGGGPTEFHLERLRRARTMPGLPLIHKKTKALDFFRRASETSDDLNIWRGELYFELHRGTYTSQAENKKQNRLCEHLLRDAEWLSSFRGVGNGYPAEKLEEAWKLVLLNQFHDIIPGSSVNEVYRDSDADYAKVRQIGEEVIAEALQGFAGELEVPGGRSGLALFHNSSVPGQVEAPLGEGEEPVSFVVGPDRVPVQVIEDEDGRRAIFGTPESALGAVAVGAFSDKLPTISPLRLKAGPKRLENDQWKVKFDGNGHITSIESLDDHPVEFIRPGGLGNNFQLFEDLPRFWDAWDVDAFSFESWTDLIKAESFEVVEKGPVRAAVELVKKFGSSTIRQRISLGPTPGIRFDTWVDWHESHRMLKVAFPVNVHSQRAAFEIQWGHVERPTHQNTSWDVARFEVCCQRWFDLSEG